jgi:hypothetical protein
MKKFILFALFSFSCGSFAQEATTDSKWAVSFGVNFIDNTNSQDNNYLDFSNWNSTYTFSKFSAQYFYNSNFSVSSEFSINKLERTKMQNGGTINENLSFYAIDVNARYNVGSYLKLPNRFSLEPIVGVGNYWTDNAPNQSLNTGLAIGYQFNEDYGLRFQTLGKFASEKQTVGNNMIQHSLELYFRL